MTRSLSRGAKLAKKAATFINTYKVELGLCLYGCYALHKGYHNGLLLRYHRECDGGGPSLPQFKQQQRSLRGVAATVKVSHRELVKKVTQIALLYGMQCGCKRLYASRCK